MNKILIICGPTATGKTALALKLAKKLNGDLLVADSRQVYKGMDIVTGKDLPENYKLQITNDKLSYYKGDEIRVWLTDLVDPKENFSVAEWHSEAIKVIRLLWKQNKLPIVVGGTGLYIKSLTGQLETINVPQNLPLRKLYSTKIVAELYETLSQLDPVRAASLNVSDRKNPRRLLRAIEVADWKLQNGEIKSEQLDTDHLLIGLNLAQEKLFRQIELRVEKRLHDGALEEIEKLIKGGVSWQMQSMSGLGYRQLKEYATQKLTLKESVLLWIKEEQKYAKRQITWFKKDNNITWFEADNKNLLQKVEKFVANWYNE